MGLFFLGVYFVTIVTKNRECYFGDIISGGKNATCCVSLSEIGNITNQFWLDIHGHFPFVSLDEFVIMPNHVHRILIIDHSDDSVVETLHATSLQHATSLRRRQPSSPGKNRTMSYISPKYGSLSTIIRSFKSAVTKSSRLINPEFAWQTRFHDHIIRNEKSLNSIRQYIRQNRFNWQNDTNNPDWKENESNKTHIEKIKGAD